MRPVLDLLAEHRILRPGERDGYEIFHDVLAGAVLGWRERYELERAVANERRHRRRAVGVAIAALAAVALMIGITAFALVQRQDARDQATVAEARALDAFATSQLVTDPQLSVILAAQAARQSPTVQADDVLREALLLDRMRGVVRTGGPVRATAYAPRGGRMALASEDGIARLIDSGSHEVVAELRHDAAVTDVGFSSDGRLVVTASRDRTARVWDSSTGKRLAILRHAAPVAAISFAPGGRILVTGGHSVSLWRDTGGTVVRRFRQPVRRFSPRRARTAASWWRSAPTG